MIHHRFTNFLNKTSTRIALFIAIICTTLLFALNYFVNKQSHEALVTAFTISQTHQGHIYSIPASHIRVSPLETYKLETEQDRFSRYINIATIIAVCASFILGIIVAKYTTKPLKQLNVGIKKLQENDYTFKLSRTGTDEFDEVVVGFNKLIKQLHKTENLRKNLISDASHELKTPITSLIGQLQGAKDGVITLDAEKISLLLSQAHRLNDLVDKMQEYTKLRSKSLHPKFEKIKLNSFVHKSLSYLLEKIEKKHFIIRVNIDPTLIIRADKELLSRIIINLVDNSLRHSKGNKIIIEGTKDYLAIKDNGIGISEHELSLIFERFYRVDSSRSRKTGGLGLGLAIVKEMVESQGWTIQAVNRDHHKGLSIGIIF